MPAPTVQEKPANCDQRIWTCPPSEDRADIRSATPMGFARAVYQANAALSFAAPRGVNSDALLELPKKGVEA